jgi:RNA polymerase sigma factor (sigma-70 family)
MPKPPRVPQKGPEFMPAGKDPAKDLHDRHRDHCLGALMAVAQEGDGCAYGKLLEETTALLRRVIRARNPYLQHCDIEDRVQDILLSVHEARATYDPKRPFLPWLMAIARNRLADEARRYTRRAAHEVAIDEPLETFSCTETNTSMDATVDSMALHGAIKKLPAAQRKAIEMVKLREMSHAEASEATGMSVAALKITVHRGVKQLRKLMGSEV